MPPTDREVEIRRQLALLEYACRALASAEQELRESEIQAADARRIRENAARTLDQSRNALQTMGAWDDQTEAMVQSATGGGTVLFNRDRLAYVAKMDKSLSGPQKLVLLMLGSYAGPIGQVYVDRRRLANESSLADRTVRECIKALVERGWLQAEQGQHAFRILVRDPDDIMAGPPPSTRRSLHHRLELTEQEASRMLTLAQEKETELTALLTSESRVAEHRRQEITADIDVLVDLQQKLSRFLSTYNWHGKDAG